MQAKQITELEEIATRVEQRFARVYDSDDAYRQVSLGWWLVIKRLGLALYIGEDKPPVESGDGISISIRKRPFAVHRRAS